MSGLRRCTDTSKRNRLKRRLGAKAYRVATERAYLGFAVRSNPVMMGPTAEFPGVDIDAIYEKVCRFVCERGSKCRRLAGHVGAHTV